MKICFCLFDSQFVYWMSVYYIYCCYSVAQSCPALHDPMDCSIAGSPVPHHLPEFAQVHAHWTGDASSHLILWCPLLLLASVFTIIRDFSNELTVLIRWPKYWSFSFSISPSNDYPGLISLKIDWFDPLSVQGTLKTFLQHHSSKAPILQQSAFFMVQLSQLYLTTGKTITLTIWTLVGKVMSLPFNTLSSFVIAFLPSSCLLISWLQSPSALILEPKNRKSVLLPPFPHLFAMKWCGQIPWSYFFKY